METHTITTETVKYCSPGVFSYTTFFTVWGVETGDTGVETGDAGEWRLGTLESGDWGRWGVETGDAGEWRLGTLGNGDWIHCGVETGDTGE